MVCFPGFVHIYLDIAHILCSALCHFVPCTGTGSKSQVFPSNLVMVNQSSTNPWEGSTCIAFVKLELQLHQLQNPQTTNFPDLQISIWGKETKSDFANKHLGLPPDSGRHSNNSHHWRMRIQQQHGKESNYGILLLGMYECMQMSQCEIDLILLVMFIFICCMSYQRSQTSLVCGLSSIVFFMLSFGCRQIVIMCCYFDDIVQCCMW